MPSPSLEIKPELDLAQFRVNLASIAGGESRRAEGDDPWGAIAAKHAQGGSRQSADENETAMPATANATNSAGRSAPREAVPFVPLAPANFVEAGLTESEVEALILKFLLNRGTASGRRIAGQIKLPFALLEKFLQHLKDDRLVVYKAAAPLGDYLYEATEVGCERARRYSERCTYFGAAPVPLADYVASVHAQSLSRQRPRFEAIQAAFADLVLSPEVIQQVAQAVHAGRGMFLHGAPGNGKTSIAERITRSFGESIWVPRAISASGEIVRLYDPSNHEALPAPVLGGENAVDERWIRIRRPTIVVGGELTLESLEITSVAATGIGEAALQMKSNCGTLVIDDFGRQRVGPKELLNRWIVPMEKRYDFIHLPSGRKIQIPFDQMLVFSTNLEPRDLVDEAFLRRIPYKIEIVDPSEGQFRELFRRTAAAMSISYPPETLDYLLLRHYQAHGRRLRCCHARDLLMQIENLCSLLNAPRQVTRESLDAAVKNYFAMMDVRGEG